MKISEGDDNFGYWMGYPSPPPPVRSNGANTWCTVGGMALGSHRRTFLFKEISSIVFSREVYLQRGKSANQSTGCVQTNLLTQCHCFSDKIEFSYLFHYKRAISQIDFNWWFVRVTLVVDWLFLPQNFGLVVRTCEGILLFYECTNMGWWFYLQVVGTPNHYRK